MEALAERGAGRVGQARTGPSADDDPAHVLGVTVVPGRRELGRLLVRAWRTHGHLKPGMKPLRALASLTTHSPQLYIAWLNGTSMPTLPKLADLEVVGIAMEEAIAALGYMRPAPRLSDLSPAYRALFAALKGRPEDDVQTFALALHLLLREERPDSDHAARPTDAEES